MGDCLIGTGEGPVLELEPGLAEEDVLGRLPLDTGRGSNSGGGGSDPGPDFRGRFLAGAGWAEEEDKGGGGG